MKIRMKKLAALAIAAVTLLSSFTVSAEEMAINELTGLPMPARLANQRPIAAMVDNEKVALDHYGVNDADIVYEMMNSTKNGRITRLMCLYKDYMSVARIGSIRSVRPTNFLIAQEYNAIICHDGGPFYINPYAAMPYSNNFSGGFTRVNNGKRTEFTEYIVPSDMTKKFAASGVSKTYTQYYQGPHFVFGGATLPAGVQGNACPANSIVLPFPHNASTLTYNPTTLKYQYGEYGRAHVDALHNNAVTAFDNVIIQACDFVQYDENGYLIYNCIGNGVGFYVSGGQATPILWAKTSELAPTKFFSQTTMQEIIMNPGKTYIAIVPLDGWAGLSIS